MNILEINYVETEVKDTVDGRAAELSWRGFIVLGPSKYIISDNDFVHLICDSKEKPELGMICKFRDGEDKYSILMVRPDVAFDNWQDLEQHSTIRAADFSVDAHNWGVKDRVRSNYRLFQQSLREIGYTQAMPVWE